MRRDERVTVQGPVKKQQPDGMSHRGGGGSQRTVPPCACWFFGVEHAVLGKVQSYFVTRSKLQQLNYSQTG